MPNSDELDAAVEAGVIGRSEADRLAGFLAQRDAGQVAQNDRAADDDAEAARFVRGFHDIFLTIGVVLLLLGVGYSSNILRDGIWFLPVAAASWALAEYLSKQKRLTLPSIALSIAFGVAGGLAIDLIIHLFGGIAPAESPSSGANFRSGALIGGISALAASLAFYLRFRLPFTLAQIVAALAFTLAAILNAFAPDLTSIYDSPVFLILGVAVFLLAVRLDIKDPERRTILADNAFWLHLAAAPLIVHIGVGFVWGPDVANLSAGDALRIMALIAAVAFVALLIDRRAMLVAGLFYFGALLFVLIRNTAIEEGSVFAITLLILGSALLLLGIGWRPARQFILTKLTPPGLARRLPTLRQA